MVCTVLFSVVSSLFTKEVQDGLATRLPVVVFLDGVFECLLTVWTHRF